MSGHQDNTPDDEATAVATAIFALLRERDVHPHIALTALASSLGQLVGRTMSDHSAGAQVVLRTLNTISLEMMEHTLQLQRVSGISLEFQPPAGQA